jgi:hypothetical protein
VEPPLDGATAVGDEPTLHVFSHPEHPAPACLVVPPAYTAGPGAWYPLSAEWMLTLMPGSFAPYAPGNLTVAGLAVPVPPSMLIW